jgi:predicted nucleotidyltransferase
LVPASSLWIENIQTKLWRDDLQHVFSLSGQEIGMHTEIEKHRDSLRALCDRYGVLRLELFGSGARGADFDSTRSDADFLVEFDKDSDLPALDQFVGFAEALERLLGRSVDLVEASALRNPYVRATIDRSKELIYAA